MRGSYVYCEWIFTWNILDDLPILHGRSHLQSLSAAATLPRQLAGANEVAV